jgi:NAD(P)-dependent dehydrogenase (short-subunit alcohol dehydrogenase family)
VDRGESAAASVQSLGTNCHFVKADVSIAEDCFRLVDTALQHFGNINGLVNSAAVPDRGTLLDTRVLESWKLMSMNQVFSSGFFLREVVG